jgi:hypothetical protein
MVEHFFRDLTQQRLRRGVFHNLSELESALQTYMVQHNENPKPFIWTAKAPDILQKVKQGQAPLNKRASVLRTTQPGSRPSPTSMYLRAA